MKVTDMKRLTTLLLSCLAASSALGAPATVIRFSATGAQNGCFRVIWRDQVLLYNSGGESRTVHITGMSNGTPNISTPDEVVVAPMQIVSLNVALQDAWTPAPLGSPGAKLWMLHLDVPSGITIESRNEYKGYDSCISPQPLDGSAGYVPLPVFRAPTPANVPQVHLGTDTGSVLGRINVGIYNASAVVANALIVVRRVCDDAITDQRNVSVPPDTLLQFGNLSEGGQGCSKEGPQWMRYTTITVDQPSMTYASALTEHDNGYLGIAPQNGLTVPMSTTFE
jgi:hypothetical protein